MLLALIRLTVPALAEERQTQADELQALAEALAGRAGAQLTFVEYRDLELLTVPLELHGRLVFLPPARFEKIVETPYRETQLIDGGRVWVDREGQRTRSFSLRRAPELAAFVQAMGRLLSGDAAGLRDHFETHLETAENRDWQLELRPRDRELADRITRIRLQGTGDDLTRIETELPDGQTQRMDIRY